MAGPSLEIPSLAVLSGKGGVGKTFLAINLALALHAEGLRVLLVDGDLGLANVDVMLDIKPRHSLRDVLIDDLDVSEAICPVEPGLDVLPAASGHPELARMDPALRDRLVERLAPVLPAWDYLLFDLGAGLTESVRLLASLAATRALVVTPEPTALTDTYAVMKILSQTDGVRDFLVIMNQVEHQQEAAATFGSLRKVCRDFLHFEPVLLGAVQQDSRAIESILRQTPLIRLFPSCQAARDIVVLARRLLRILPASGTGASGRQQAR